MKRFVGEGLRDVRTEKGGCPVSFFWGGREYRVAEMLSQWHDFDYSRLAPKRDWRSRRHRNYYQIRTESGECFELYCDRGTKLGAPKHWVLAAVMERDGERPCV
jgi:hypothetical protein